MRREDPFCQVVVPDHRVLDRGTLRGILGTLGSAWSSLTSFCDAPRLSSDVTLMTGLLGALPAAHSLGELPRRAERLRIGCGWPAHAQRLGYRVVGTGLPLNQLL